MLNRTVIIKLADGSWSEDRHFETLKVGDIFKMREPTGEFSHGGNSWTVIELLFDNDPPAVLADYNHC